MKLLLILSLMVAVGVVVGAGLTWYDLGPGRDVFDTYWLPASAQSPSSKAPEPDKSRLGPLAEVVGKAEHDFGTMEVNEKGRHTFKIRSVGSEPLVLTKGKTTCSCTLSKLTGSKFAPGETADVTLEWTSKTFGPEPEYAQSAEIMTNDPHQPKVVLKVKGIIAETYRVLPSSLPLGTFSASEGTSATFQIYGFRTETVDIQDVTFEDEKLASLFEVTFEPLPPEELTEEKGAKSGQLAKLTVKPGLSLGPISQTIQLAVKGPEGKTVRLHVGLRGNTVGDIVITGAPKSYVPSRNLVKLGILDKNVGGKVVLYVFVKGEHRHETEFSVGDIQPAGYLTAAFSEAQDLNEGKTVKRTLTIEVPPGKDPIARSGSDVADYGSIVLKTTHPDHKEVKIFVKFDVQ